MGVYSLNHINESSNYLDDVQEKEIYTEDFMEAALQNVYENTCNHHAMMKSIGVAELAVYESTGEEIVYEAGTASGIFDKIKSMLKKIWEKMKSLFTKFLAKMQSFGKDDKAFVTKYRKEILEGSTKDLNVKGFEFDTEAVTVNDKNGAWSNMQSINPNFKSLVSGSGMDTWIKQDLKNPSGVNSEKSFFGESESEFNDKLRAAALGQTGEMDSSEFQKELFEKFRKGESKPQTLDDKDIKKGEMINFLMNTNTIERDIGKDMKNCKKIIEDLIKKADKAQRDMGKFDSKTDEKEITDRAKGVSFYARASAHLNEALNIVQMVSAARMKAFNDKRKQYKSICVKLIGRKAKNEGYEYEDEHDSSYNESSYESILGNINFI